MDTIRVLPHRRQSDKEQNCGAACLAMILEHYRIRPSNLREITSQVVRTNKDGRPLCFNDLIVKYALRRGLYCSAVSAKDPRSFIPYCLEHGLDLFVNYHPVSGKSFAHYSLVSYATCDNVYLNDPQYDSPIGVNFEISFDDLCQSMKKMGRDDELALSDTFIVLSKSDSDVSVRWIADGDDKFPVFNCLLDNTVCILDPFAGRWLEVSKFPRVSPNISSTERP